MKQVYEQLSSLDSYDIVFVCGLYKSGTSLLTTILETKEEPFYNPAQQTNPFGEAVSRDGGNYRTRECHLLFRLNKLLIRSANNQYNAIHSITSYLNNYPKPMVLKDPQLLITLPYWLEGTLSSCYKTVVAFTARDKRQLQISWKKAPFTGRVLNKNGQAIQILLDYQQKQQNLCISLSIDYQEFAFNDLIKLVSNDHS